MSREGERVLALAQITALERAGTPIHRGVLACLEAARGALRRELAAVAGRLEAGDPPSRALAAGGLVARDQIQVIAAAEKLDGAGDAIDHAARILWLRRRLRRCARILSYPLALFVAAGALIAYASGEMGLLVDGPYGVRAASEWYSATAGLTLAGVGLAGLLWLRWARLPRIASAVPLLGDAIRRGQLADVLCVAEACEQNALPLAEVLGELELPRGLARRLRAALEEGAPLSEALGRVGLATADEVIELEAMDPEELAAEAADDLERLVRALRGGLLVVLGVAVYFALYGAVQGVLAFTHAI